MREDNGAGRYGLPRRRQVGSIPRAALANPLETEVRQARRFIMRCVPGNSRDETALKPVSKLS